MKKYMNVLAVLGISAVMAGCVALEEARQVNTVQKTTAAVPAKLEIANFDSGMKPNLIGGDYGAWDKDPNDETQFCQAEYNADVKVGDAGNSLKLIYDVDSPEPAYNGLWMKLENANFTPYESIVLSIKGDDESGFTNKLVIELKNLKGESGKALIAVTNVWEEKMIPLAAFSGITDFSQMSEFVLVFDDANSDPKTGAVYIDNIYVKK